MDEDRLIYHKPHLGDLALIFSDCCAVGADAFNLIWCALEFYKARVGVLVSGLDGFSLDGMDDAVDG